MSAKPIRWVMTGAGMPLVPTEFDTAALAPNEVVVEIAGCGVCQSDLDHYYDGVCTKHELPLALGHEISGHVVDAGADALWYTDRAVVIPALIPCGRCEACLRGRAEICQDRKMPGNDMHGGFATHITVPVHGLCVVDERRMAALGIDLADLSVIADGVTRAYHAVVRAGVRKKDLVVVHGLDDVGGYAAQIATALGGIVVALDEDEDRLAAIRSAGVALALNSAQMAPHDVKSEIEAFAARRSLPRSGWIVLECSGTRAGHETAYGLIDHGATLVIVGSAADKVDIRLSDATAYDARVIGSWGCPPELYPAALELVMNGRVRICQFAEKHPLREINRVFEAAHAAALKRHAVLVPEL